MFKVSLLYFVFAKLSIRTHSSISLFLLKQLTSKLRQNCELKLYLAYRAYRAAPVHTKCRLKVYGGNLLLIDFRLPFQGAQYVKCRAQRCTEANRQYLFPGHVDTNSLVVQDEYVFTQVGVVVMPDLFFSRSLSRCFIKLVVFIFSHNGCCL